MSGVSSSIDLEGLTMESDPVGGIEAIFSRNEPRICKSYPGLENAEAGVVVEGGGGGERESGNWEDAGTQKRLEVIGDKPTIGEKKVRCQIGAHNLRMIKSVEGTGHSDWNRLLFWLSYIQYM